MTQTSRSQLFTKNKLLGKQACPDENCLQAQRKNIVETMAYQTN